MRCGRCSRKKPLIVPGALMKAAKFTGRLAPEKLMLAVRLSYAEP